jgi:eukaryotic-like serine/threonine-protein kinase
MGAYTRSVGDSMIKRNVLLLIAAAMIASVLAAGCTFNVGNPTPSASPTNTYDSSKGFTIKYSADWSKPQEQQNGTLVLFLTPTNNAAENLNVQVGNLSANQTLATLTKDITSEAQSNDNFTQIEATNTTLAGLPGYKIVYTATVNGDQLKALQTWTVKDGKAYVITYKAAPSNYDTYASTAQQMIDSFQIT